MVILRLREDSGRKFYVVDLQHEDLKGLIGPFSSREAAERWQSSLSAEGLWEGTEGSSGVCPIYGPIEAEVKLAHARAKRRSQP